MEPLPSETPFVCTPGRDSSEEDMDTWLRLLVDSWSQDFVQTSEIFCTPAKDPPAMASLPTSLLSLSPASEGIGTADAGSIRPVLDLMDSDYGGECGRENRQQLLKFASPANYRDVRLRLPAEDQAGILKFNPAISSCFLHPERALGDSEPTIFRNASRSEFSRANSTGAKYNACAKEPKRRLRSRNWTGEEKDAFLEVKVEAQTAVKGKDWDFISGALKGRYAFERSAKSCEDLWGTLLKSFKVIRHHESMNHSSNWYSYWELDENERLERQLPKFFSFRWYQLIESICAGKGKLAAADQQWTTKDPGLTSLVGAGEYFSMLQLIDGFLNPQKDLLETSTSNTLTMSKEGLGPYLQSVVIDALRSALKPLATILQCEHEEKQEFDAKMKALDKKRRALDLEEIQIKRQRFGQHQRTSRLTCRHKQQAGLPVKNPSVKEIIPAFKELNIGKSHSERIIDLHDSKKSTEA